MFLRCRKFKLIPKSLNVNLKSFAFIPKYKSNVLETHFSSIILNEAIKDCFRTINLQKKILRFLWKDFNKSNISLEDKNQFKTYIFQYQEKLFLLHQKKHDNKFMKLSFDLLEKFKLNQKWFVNLTNISPPQEVCKILQLGPKFCLPTTNKKIPVNEIISSVEHVLEKLPFTERNHIRTPLCNILYNISTKPDNFSNVDRVILEYQKKTFQFKRDNPDILILKADKGEITVLMDKNEYQNKMFDLLSDQNTYISVGDKFNINSLQAKCNKFISMVEKNKWIDKRYATGLRRYNSIPAKVYGLVKVHKIGHPLRPIVASIGTPTYNLSKMFSIILRNVTGKTVRSVKNSNELKKCLVKVKLPKGYSLMSLDVKSLFTNIPNELVYNSIKVRWRIIKKYTNIPLKEFLEGLKLVLENNYCFFNGGFYLQIDGSPMGSPMSPVLADLVMEILEESVLNKVLYHIPFFFRYVDDIILAVPINKIQDITTKFNTYHKKLQFTYELEVNNQLSFLDLLIKRHIDGKLIFDWYHKETWSCRYLHFDSCLPIQYKRNTVTILTHKILDLVDIQFQQKSFELLNKILEENNYPNSFVQKTINNTIKKRTNKIIPCISKTPIDFDRLCIIPFVKSIHNKIVRILSKFKIVTIAKRFNTVGELFFSNIKEKTPKAKLSNLIYEITCECGLKYIGQTRQHLEKRIYEHKYNFQNNNESHSALCKHAISKQHTPNWNITDIKILAMFNPTFDLRTKLNINEIIHIKKNNNTLNFKTDSITFPAVYNQILNI